MDIEITKERDLPLMSKKRYTFMMTFKGATPSRTQIRDAFAKQAKADPELTVIKHVYTRYGVEKAKVIAHVYTDKADMVKYEEKELLDKHAKKEEPKKEEAAPAEAPAEEKKEEAAEEEKKEEAAEDKKE